MLYDCVTWSPRACHYETLRRAHQSFLTRCIGWRKNNRDDHTIPFLDTLVKAESESTKATSRRRWILFVRFVARMEDTRLPKCVMLGELVGGAGCVGAREKSEWGVSRTTSGLSASTPIIGRLQSRKRGNAAGRRNKGTFHGERARCGESQGETTASSCCCCCCCFLTLTDPLRIQPWSQDRRNQTKSTGNRR